MLEVCFETTQPCPLYELNLHKKENSCLLSEFRLFDHGLKTQEMHFWPVIELMSDSLTAIKVKPHQYPSHQSKYARVTITYVVQ